MLAYSLRKHAGVRSYVLPMDLSDSETWGNTDVDWNMQHQVRGRQALCVYWRQQVLLIVGNYPWIAVSAGPYRMNKTGL